MAQYNHQIYHDELQPFPTDVELVPGEIHICLTKLDLPETLVGEYESLLCPQEKMRAAGFHFKRDRDRFVAGRGLLKTFLSKYLHVASGEINIGYRTNGKPFLYSAGNSADVHFNLSHSEDSALYAFTCGDEIGVDLEKIQAFPEMPSIVERFFSKRERALINALPKNDQISAFFAFWTRKEALSKLTGNGLRQAVEKLDVTLPAPKSSSCPTAADTSKIPSRCFIRNLQTWPGFAAAIAAFREIGRVWCWRWQV
jgi:4'-phosphopantetheinyl transferase